MKPVCPCCSSSVLFPSNTGGYDCGHCEHQFDEPVVGCPLNENGNHDETWMNGGFCACGANDAESS